MEFIEEIIGLLIRNGNCSERHYTKPIIKPIHNDGATDAVRDSSPNTCFVIGLGSESFFVKVVGFFFFVIIFSLV